MTHHDEDVVALNEDNRGKLFALLTANMPARVRRIELWQAGQTVLQVTIAARIFGVPIEHAPSGFVHLILALIG